MIRLMAVAGFTLLVATSAPQAMTVLPPHQPDRAITNVAFLADLGGHALAVSVSPEPPSAMSEGASDGPDTFARHGTECINSALPLLARVVSAGEERTSSLASRTRDSSRSGATTQSGRLHRRAQKIRRELTVRPRKNARLERIE